MYQTYFSSIVNNVSNIISLIPIVAKGLESVNSIGDVLTAEDVEDNRKKKKVKDVRGDITFTDVSFCYPDSRTPVLEHLNFHIQPGETIAFVGPSGAGKSTILNMVIGFSKASVLMLCCISVIRVYLNTEVIFGINYLDEQWESHAIDTAKQLSVAVPQI